MKLKNEATIGLQDMHNQNQVLDFAKLNVQFPKISDEEWKYLNLRQLKETPWVKHLPIVGDNDFAPAIAEDSWNIVFINGTYQPSLSNIRAINATLALQTECKQSSHSKSQRTDFLSSLNEAYLEQILTLNVFSTQQKPIRIYHFLTQSEFDHMMLSSLHIVVHAGVEVKIEERFEGKLESRKHLLLSDLKCEVKENANVIFVTTSELGQNSLTFGRSSFDVAENARMTHFTFSHGSGIFRREFDFVLSGKESNIKANAIALVETRCQTDIRTRIQHTASQTKSHQSYRYVVRGRGIFNGKIVIPQTISGVEAMQSNKNLVLTPEGEMNTKPELQIDSGDVLCSHGATVGTLNPDEIFYFKSRGIDHTIAEKMLTEAFLSEVIFDSELPKFFEDELRKKVWSAL